MTDLTAAGSGTDDVDVMVPGMRSWARRILRPVFSTWLRLSVEGVGHVPPEGRVLVASTHASHADSIALALAIERPIYFLGDRRLTKWPVLGPQLPKLGMVPVERGTADAQVLVQLAQLLENDAAVTVYPEGSRSRDGRIYRPRSGVARLAAQTRSPVVPAAVNGTHEVWPTGEPPKVRGGRIVARFGAMIDPPDDTPKARREFSELLHDTLVELSGKPKADEFAPVGGPESEA